MTEPLVPRDLVWVPLGPADEPHRAIVLETAAETTVVSIITSTSKRRNLPHICVEPRTRDGIALRLTAPTYFYVTNVIEVPANVLVRYGRCPPQLFVKILALVESSAT